MFNLNNLQQNIKIGLKQNMYIIHTPKWFEEKTKSEYTIWSMMRGNAYITIADTTHTVSEGDIVLFAPGVSHTAHSDEGGCEFMFQQFTLEQGNDINILGELNLSGIIKSDYMGSECVSYGNKMKALGIVIYNLSLDIYADFLVYISKILNCVQNGQHIPFFEKISSSPHSALWRAMSYIGEHFMENFSIKEVAENAGFSEKYFIRSFRQRVGTSPKQYLIQCRMRYASYMLVHSEEKIQDIALYMGYADVYSFSKAFKKYYDETPSEFRKNHIY